MRLILLSVLAGLVTSLAPLPSVRARPSVRVMEVCPVTDSEQVFGSTGESFPLRIIEANIGYGRIYGESQPETYFGHAARWLRPATSEVSESGQRRDFRGVVSVSFTGDLDKHGAALAAYVPNPEAFVVCRAKMSYRHTKRISDELASWSPPVTAGPDEVLGVRLTLQGTAEATAVRVAAVYGDVVAIQVGHLRFPTKEVVGSGCGTVEKYVPHASLLWKRPKTIRVKVGAQKSGGLVAGVVSFVAKAKPGVRGVGGVSGVITRPNSDIVVGSFAGLTTLGSQELSPKFGQVATMTFSSGTDSCDGSLGYVLPPGKYEMRYGFDLMVNGRVTKNVQAVPIPLVIAP